MFRKKVLPRKGHVFFAVAILLFSHVSSWASSVALLWDPDASPSATGYTVFYGLASGVYQWQTNAGAQTNATVRGLTPNVNYYFAVQAYDANGNVSPLSSEITVNVPPPPVIYASPQGQAVVAGATTAFAVAAGSSAPVTYHWFHGGTPISPTNSAFYLYLFNVKTTDAGNYNVVVANSGGSVTSSVAALTVLPPLQTLNVSMKSGQGLQLQFTGTPNSPCVLQATTNLAPPICWQPVVTNSTDNNGNWSFLDTNALAMDARFYRTYTP